MADRFSASDLCSDGCDHGACVLEQSTLPLLLLSTQEYLPVRAELVVVFD